MAYDGEFILDEDGTFFHAGDDGEFDVCGVCCVGCPCPDGLDAAYRVSWTGTDHCTNHSDCFAGKALEDSPQDVSGSDCSWSFLDSSGSKRIWITLALNEATCLWELKIHCWCWNPPSAWLSSYIGTKSYRTGGVVTPVGGYTKVQGVLSNAAVAEIP